MAMGYIRIWDINNTFITYVSSSHTGVRIGFIKPSYHVNESSTTIRLTVELIGAFEIELTAFVECGGGTATSKFGIYYHCYNNINNSRSTCLHWGYIPAAVM